MTSPMSRRFVVFAGLLATPVATSVTQHKVPGPPRAATDERVGKLEKFFDDHNCPLKDEAAEFIEAADRNQLDWRLLPSISVVESGGGKDYRNNNVLGWANCDQRFTSVAAGIHSVARRLSHSRLYRHKSIDRILATYNPRPEYTTKVKTLMHAIRMTQVPAEASAN